MNVLRVEIKEWKKKNRLSSKRFSNKDSRVVSKDKDKEMKKVSSMVSLLKGVTPTHVPTQIMLWIIWVVASLKLI